MASGIATLGFAVEVDGGTFSARLHPARIPSLAGVLPLPSGHWRLRTRPAPGDEPTVPLLISPELRQRLPLVATVDGKPFRLSADGDNHAHLRVQADLSDDEAGPFNQRRLRETVYAPHRRQALREAVVYSSFGGRQYSDSPRAIHQELSRRRAGLEHLWVVRDGALKVPEGATAVRRNSREHYEAMARARYLVFNDDFPRWFRRRDDQVGAADLARDAAEAAGLRHARQRVAHPGGSGRQLAVRRLAEPVLDRDPAPGLPAGRRGARDRLSARRRPVCARPRGGLGAPARAPRDPAGCAHRPVRAHAARARARRLWALPPRAADLARLRRSWATAG